MVRLALVALIPALLALTACSTPASTATPDFTLSASGVSVAAGASGSASVTISRTNFSGAVALSVSGAPAGVSAAPSEASTSGDSVTIDVAVDAGVAPHSATLTVAGTGGGMSRSAELTLEITGSPVTIDAVAIEGYGGSSQARQGRSIDVEITGTNLSGIGLAKLGDISGYVDTNNNLSASISFYVPHGEPLGTKDLTVIADAGTATVENAVTVTAITAGPDGSDDDGEGTPDQPYRTLSRANQQADPGDSILLLDGSYDEAAGETFPVEVESDVTVAGESEAGTVVQGNGADDCLRPGDGVGVSNLTVDGCDSGIYMGDGTLIVDSVTSRDNASIGIWISDAADAVTITDSTFSGNGVYGLFDRSSGVTTVSGSTLDGNLADGIRTLIGAGTLIVTDSTVSNNGAGGNWPAIRLSAAGSTVVLDGVTVIDNVAIGIVSEASSIDLTLRNSTVTGNGTGVGHDGVRITGAPAAVDLGSADDPGNNTIEGNADVQLSDGRPAGQTVVIQAIGVDLGGVGAPPSGLQTGVDSDANRWEILNAGNQIDFGP